MHLNSKIRIAVIALTFFVIGGLTFTAYQVGAFGNGENNDHKFGFWRGGFGGHDGIDKDSEEWQAKKEEWKTKMEEFKANRTENGDKPHGFRHPFLFGGHKGFGGEINHEVVNLENGVQITITSDNPDLVQKLHDLASKFNKSNE